MLPHGWAAVSEPDPVATPLRPSVPPTLHQALNSEADDVKSDCDRPPLSPLIPTTVACAPMSMPPPAAASTTSPRTTATTAATSARPVNAPSCIENAQVPPGLGDALPMGPAEMTNREQPMQLTVHDQSAPADAMLASLSAVSSGSGGPGAVLPLDTQTTVAVIVGNPNGVSRDQPGPMPPSAAENSTRDFVASSPNECAACAHATTEALVSTIAPDSSTVEYVDPVGTRVAMTRADGAAGVVSVLTSANSTEPLAAEVHPAAVESATKAATDDKVDTACDSKAVPVTSLDAGHGDRAVASEQPEAEAAPATAPGQLTGSPGGANGMDEISEQLPVDTKGSLDHPDTTALAPSCDIAEGAIVSCPHSLISSAQTSFLAEAPPPLVVDSVATNSASEEAAACHLPAFGASPSAVILSASSDAPAAAAATAPVEAALRVDTDRPAAALAVEGVSAAPPLAAESHPAHLPPLATHNIPAVFAGGVVAAEPTPGVATDASSEVDTAPSTDMMHGDGAHSLSVPHCRTEQFPDDHQLLAVRGAVGSCAAPDISPTSVPSPAMAAATFPDAHATVLQQGEAPAPAGSSAPSDDYEPSVLPGSPTPPENSTLLGPGCSASPPWRHPAPLVPAPDVVPSPAPTLVLAQSPATSVAQEAQAGLLHASPPCRRFSTSASAAVVLPCPSDSDTLPPFATAPPLPAPTPPRQRAAPPPTPSPAASSSPLPPPPPPLLLPSQASVATAAAAVARSPAADGTAPADSMLPLHVGPVVAFEAATEVAATPVFARTRSPRAKSYAADAAGAAFFTPATAGTTTTPAARDSSSAVTVPPGPLACQLPTISPSSPLAHPAVLAASPSGPACAPMLLPATSGTTDVFQWPPLFDKPTIAPMSHAALAAVTMAAFVSPSVRKPRVPPPEQQQQFAVSTHSTTEPHVSKLTAAEAATATAAAQIETKPMIPFSEASLWQYARALAAVNRQFRSGQLARELTGDERSLEGVAITFRRSSRSFGDYCFSHLLRRIQRSQSRSRSCQCGRHPCRGAPLCRTSASYRARTEFY